MRAGDLSLKERTRLCMGTQKADDRCKNLRIVRTQTPHKRELFPLRTFQREGEQLPNPLMELR
jgi:hypothetical protein